MSKTTIEKHFINRLEDVISIASEGKRVDMEVELKTQPMVQEVHIKEVDKTWHKIDTYLLIAFYTFKIDIQSYKCSKVYMFATDEESLITEEMNKDIANTRLRIDYKRFRDAHIHFQEVFF